MKRRRVILAAGACVVIAIVAVALWPGEREPSYDGKTLFEWLDQSTPYNGQVIQVRWTAAAGQAVASMEIDGVPRMLKWLTYCDHPDWRDRFVRTYGKLPDWLKSNRLEGYLVRRSGRAHVQAAMNGLLMLGRNSSAVPQLVLIAADTNSPGRAVHAGWILTTLGVAKP